MVGYSSLQKKGAKPTLFIDFDGTLCHDKFWRSIDKDNFLKIQDFLFVKNNLILNSWMRGLYSSEYVNKLIAKELNISYKEIWDIFVSDCINMDISENILDRIKGLRKYFNVILITNNMDSFTRFTVPALKLNSYFDLIINSFDLKTLKNDNQGEIFLKVTNRYGSKMEDSILIDDSKSTCNTFLKLGGMSNYITKEKPLECWITNLETRYNSSITVE